MLALEIVLPVVVLVVIPGLLLMFGLARSAGRRVPRPGDMAPLCRPLAAPQIPGQLQLFRSRDTVWRRVAKADYN